MTDTTPKPPHEDLPIEFCEPEFIDGSYSGCGHCPHCLADADQRIESMVEDGLLTDEEAQEIHRDNYARRTLDGLHDGEEPCGEGSCRCYCTGGAGHPCGCDCPRDADGVLVSDL